MSKGLVADLISGASVEFKNFEEIILSSGNDVIKAGGGGVIVRTGDGSDLIEISHSGQMLVLDASLTDRFTWDGAILKGGLHYHFSEDPYAYGRFGERYGRNQENQLVIVDAVGNETFVDGYNFDPNGPRVGGLDVFDYFIQIHIGKVPNALNSNIEVGDLGQPRVPWRFVGGNASHDD
jgi:hypothetical protein